MAYMTDSEAKETIDTLKARADVDVFYLQTRLSELNEDYAKDPWEDTAAQINRLEMRLAIRRLEAEALAIAVEKFEKVATSTEIDFEDIKAGDTIEVFDNIVTRVGVATRLEPLYEDDPEAEQMVWYFEGSNPPLPLGSWCRAGVIRRVEQ